MFSFLKLSLLCVCAYFIVGCAAPQPAATIRSTVLPSGAQGYSVSCRNAQSINACYELAGEVCTMGYDIIHSQESIGASGSASRVGDVASASVGTDWQKGLLIECKNKEQVAAAARARQIQDAQQSKADDAAIGSVLIALFAVVGMIALAGSL